LLEQEPSQALLEDGSRALGRAGVGQIEIELGSARAVAPAGRAAVALYAVTLFSSAVLLFSVQPLFAKMLLPLLGGAPAVWAVSMAFFQVLLLLGYAYAHLLGTWLGLRAGIAVHLTVLAAVWAALPVAVPRGAEPPPGDAAYVWLLGVLGLGVGAPFFALSANSPLLQAWFRRLGHAESADPYFLYAASNAGSLAALLAYPVVLEPLLPLSMQSRTWGIGYVALSALVCGCALLAARSIGRPEVPSRTGIACAASAGPLGWRLPALWTSLALVPSGLLVALTTFLTTDLASAPLLWVVPLALYLGTFILAFRERPIPGQTGLVALQPILVAGTLVAAEWRGGLSWVAAAVLGLVAFVVTSLMCHRSLYDRRPPAQHLTAFYLCVALGGALGGLFASLAAPVLFTGVLEFPVFLALGLAAGLALRPERLRARWHAVALVITVVAGPALLLEGAATLGVVALPEDWRLYALLAATGLISLLFRRPALQIAGALTIVVLSTALPNAATTVHVTRSFFGTHRVTETGGGQFRLLLHGTTLHGAERVRDKEGRKLPPPPLPLLYYHPRGPLAQGVLLARRAAGGSGPLRVGVVGLGAGAMACHARPGETWRFFEIDPAVDRIARDPFLFTFLSSCQPDADIVLGDARLTLVKEPAGSFDYLVIDAFSSDSIPVHLLTLEALKLYLTKLSPHGILALHISNQNLDLPPIVESNIAALDGIAGVYAEGERGQGALPSQVVLISRDMDALQPALGLPKARPLGAATVRAWTDDFSDVASAFYRKLRSRIWAVGSGQ
jgi:hypothetical protein